MLRRPADAERAARHPCEFNVLIPMNYKSRVAALDSRYWERKVRSPAIPSRKGDSRMRVQSLKEADARR